MWRISTMVTNYIKFKAFLSKVRVTTPKLKGWSNATLIYYSASALLAMQSVVLARGILSVRLSVRPSVRLPVTSRYCVQTNEDRSCGF